MAIASLVLGVFWLFGLGSLAAVILGHLSIRNAERQGRPKSGIALAGLILGYVGTALLVVGLLGAVAIPVFLNQRQQGYTASMKADLRTVANAEESYYAANSSYSPVDTRTPGQASIVGGETITLSRGTAVRSPIVMTNSYCLDASSILVRTVWHYDSVSGEVLPGACR